jgi:hypothetical protein
MKYDKRHYAYKPTIGGRSVSADKTINDLKEASLDYVGTYSEFNPIGTHANLLAVVRKPLSIFPKRDFKLPGFKLTGGVNTCGGNITVNESIKFSKQDLLRISTEMDTDDMLIISYIGGEWGGVKNMKLLIEDIKIVTT